MNPWPSSIWSSVSECRSKGSTWNRRSQLPKMIRPGVIAEGSVWCWLGLVMCTNGWSSKFTPFIVDTTRQTSCTSASSDETNSNSIGSLTAPLWQSGSARYAWRGCAVRRRRYFVDEVGLFEMIAANGWGGRLLLADGFVAYLGAGSRAEQHAHYAVQLVWGLGHKVEVTSDRETHMVGAAVIAANTPHSLSAPPDSLLVLLIEPSGPRGRLLDAVARHHQGADIERHLATVGVPTDAADAESMRSWCERLIDAVIASTDGDLPERGEQRREVADTLDYIDDVLPGVPRLTEAASKAGISATRLTHLFTTQVGMPFRRFVLWARIRIVAQQVQAGWNLTNAAASAGFADSAHFTRVFQAMFGLVPSSILPHLEIVGHLDTS